MVDIVEATFDVAFDKPSCPTKLLLDVLSAV